MNNIINYIKEYGNITYKESPFNEVDALVYSLLPYIDLNGLITKPTPIKEVYTLVLDKFKLKTKDKFTHKNQDILEAMAKSKRYQDNIMTSYKKINNDYTQFCALTVLVPHYFKFIAYEGTDDLLVGWEENFKMSYEYPNDAQALAQQYLKDNIKLNDILVYIGGHSKGGNLAVASLMNQNILNRWKVKYIFNFDGPGFLDKVLTTKEYQKIKNKIHSYYPEESMIGMIMHNEGTKKVIKSSAHNIYQHNAHSWLVEKNHFVVGTKSKISDSFASKIDQILNSFDEDKRRQVITSFFGALRKSGYEFKSELTKINLTRMKNLLNETIHLTDEEKKLIIDVVKTIFTSSDKEVSPKE